MKQLVYVKISMNVVNELFVIIIVLIHLVRIVVHVKKTGQEIDHS